MRENSGKMWAFMTKWIFCVCMFSGCDVLYRNCTEMESMHILSVFWIENPRIAFSTLPLYFLHPFSYWIIQPTRYFPTQITFVHYNKAIVYRCSSSSSNTIIPYSRHHHLIFMPSIFNYAAIGNTHFHW